MTAKKNLSSRVALYPGSFDPVHNGHVHIIRRAAKLFDRVIVAVAANPDKQPLFEIPERVELLREALADAGNVEVITFGGLTVDNAKHLGAGVIIRGLRLVSDFESELLLDMHNRRLEPGVETLYMMPEKEYICFNSSFVKQIVKLDSSRLSDYVPACVFKRLREKYPTGGASFPVSSR